MNWKEEVRFQREQFWAMRPSKKDLIMIAFSFAFSVASISIFALIATIFSLAAL